MRQPWLGLLILAGLLAACTRTPEVTLNTPPQGQVVLSPTPNGSMTNIPQLSATPVVDIATPTWIPTEPTFANVSTFPDPSGYTWTVVANGLTKPVDLADAGDGRIFLVEQGGIIQLLKDGLIQAVPFLDLRDRVGSGGSEQGLLGLALDPGFLENGRFYVNYTDREGTTAISRFLAAPQATSADPSSEVRLMTVPQPYANHNGGGLAFGRDGYLYIGLGDGGSGGDPRGNGQSLETWLGKLLRIDVSSQVTYAIPADNPFAGSAYGEIWAYGLRNPWRFSFDRASGDLYVADVGQNKYEEVNYLHWSIGGGVNFGWDYREASHPFEGTPPAGVQFTDPVWEYGHDQGCSITGGYVYRGSMPEWQGIYLAGDYCNGRVWGLLRNPDGSWQSRLLFDWVGGNISSFGQDAGGEVYLLLHNTGEVLRLEKK
ncbi:MAG TPA: PQQ-dependent sugar dehydrogenase [Anaerolineaceae bacterium]|nr:PQQ-dependent sugar dehydrogenase [Anaerolineaceae bacterium]HOH19126.1 PQQ-dependent sugar dehydrogenase [Anaerolineaceae bacterium]